MRALTAFILLIAPLAGIVVNGLPSYAASSVTYSTTADFSRNAAVGPDGVPGTGDDHTNGASTFGHLNTSGNEVSLMPLSDVVQLAAGNSENIAIKSDGTLWAWGWNGYGQLATGDTDDRTTPTQVGTDNDWAAVTVGQHAMFAIKSNGSLWAWGYNGANQLGLGDPDEVDRLEPTQVGSDTDWVSITSANLVTYAIKQDGTLWFWGANEGYQGLGDADNRDVPTQVGTDSNWKQVEEYSSYTLGIKQDGTLWGWGYNGEGELGLGDTTDREFPTQIGSATNWRTLAISIDDVYSSGAIKTDGTLWTWGYNIHGALALGDTDDRHIPTQVGTDTDWVSISFSDNSENAMAIKLDGSRWGCGSNNGELGLGNATPYTTFTQAGSETGWKKIVFGGSDYAIGAKDDGTLWGWGNGYYYAGVERNNLTIAIPGPVSSDTNWESVSAGYLSSMGIKQDGTLWGWGYNYVGQLGLGYVAEQVIDPVQVGTDTNWSQVSTYGNDYFYSDFHTVALKTDGTLWTWGSNIHGELGLGTEDEDPHPNHTQVGTDTDWVAVSAGGTFTLALKSNGTLWAWGWNGYGQLGQGDTVARNTPTQVGVATNWAKIDGGYYDVGAIKTDGTLWTWGQNNFGQLGRGGDATVPMQVGTDTDWLESQSGNALRFAIKQNHTLWSTGYNGNGGLGLGDNTGRSVFTQVGSDTNWAAVATGNYFTLAVKQNGTLWATGGNSAGELGLGDTTDRNSFQQVGSDANWQTVSAGGPYWGGGFSLGLKTNHTLYGWGDNSYSQLAHGLDISIPHQVGSDTDWLAPDGFWRKGILRNIVINAGAGRTATWESISWLTDALPENTTIAMRVRTSADGVTYSAWSDYFTQDATDSTMGSGDVSTVSSSQYLEIELTMTTDDSFVSPVLDSFTVGLTLLGGVSGGNGGGGVAPSGVPAGSNNGNSSSTPNTPGVNPESFSKTILVYRLYNEKRSDHFYTTNTGEKGQALTQGYTDEGNLGSLYVQPVEGSHAIYRLYNPKEEDHFYTDDVAEKERAVQKGYTDEGILGYSDTSSTATTYRLYNAQLTDHFYTTSYEEVQKAIAKLHYLLEGFMKWVF